jgi:hypothetical protein
MSAAFNVVRFRVRPGFEERFVAKHRALERGFDGFLGGNLVKTGERTFCMIGRWKNFKSLEDARPQMIALLNEIRDMLEDLGNGLGVTDPVSGEVVAQIPSAQPSKRAAKKRPARKAKRKAKPKARAGASKPKRTKTKKKTARKKTRRRAR